MSDTAVKQHRRIACVRCRRTKKKCDHAVPSCGQCSRAGVECRQLRAQRTGDYITVPISYYQRLEAKARDGSPGPRTAIPTNPVQDHVVAQANPHVPLTPPSVENGGVQTSDISMAWDGSCSDEALVGRQGSTCGESGFGVVPPAETSQTWPTLQDTSKADEAVTSIVSGSEPVMAIATSSQPIADVEDSSLGITWEIEMYANVYLAHVHKMYPFLDENSIRRWMRTCSRGQALEGNHKGLILRMLCATGAFMCSSFSQGCPHLREATSLTQEALGKFYTCAMQQRRVVRSQVCLLRVIHAIYGPRPELIHETLTLALAECAQLLDMSDLDPESNPDTPSASQSDSVAADADEQKRQIILACHQINEVVACGWDRPDMDHLRRLGDKLSTCSDRLSVSQPPSSSPIYLRQFHKIRRIQHKVRLFHEAAERWGLDREAKVKWKAEITEDVEDWRAALYQAEEDDGAYALSSKNYTQKVYDYTICLLHEADPSSMVVEDLYVLLWASSDACRRFRASQASNKGILVRTWSALAIQFRVGILLLYCFWATPTNLRTAAYSLAESAVTDCSETLLCFAKRWRVAGVFHDTFMCLAAQTPFTDTAEAWKFPQAEVTKMESVVETLRGLRTPQNVLAIVETIVQWPPISRTEDTDLFFAGTGLDPMDLFEIGQADDGWEPLSFEM